MAVPQITKYKSLFGNTNSQKYSKPAAISLGKSLLSWLDKSEKNLFIQDFLLESRIKSRTFYYLLKKFPELATDYENAKSIIEHRLITGALENRLNFAVVRMLLIRNHNWKSEKELKQIQEQKQKLQLEQIYVLGDGTRISF